MTTAGHTFDVFSTLDGLASDDGAGWGCRRAGRGLEFLAHRPARARPGAAARPRCEHVPGPRRAPGRRLGCVNAARAGDAGHGSCRAPHAGPATGRRPSWSGPRRSPGGPPRSVGARR